MDTTRIILEGLFATTMMTVFSYIVANVRGKQFREPELLNELLSRSELFRLKLSKKSSTGWILHYLIGWIFVILFEVIWQNGLISFSILSGALLGFIAGLVGVVGWQLMFWINKNPSKTTRFEYYLQLMIAHVIFGISVAIIYKLW